MSRRRFEIRLRRGIRSARATVDGRRARAVRGRRWRAIVDLWTKPRKTVRVRVVARTRAGKFVREAGRYRTCVKRR